MLNFANRTRALKQRGDEGFSLLELVFAIVILGILMAIAIPIYNNQIKEGVLATLKSDVTQTAGQVSAAVGKADESQAFIFNPCYTTVNFDQKLKVQTDPKNVITCFYYGNSSARTASEKKQAYNSYQWCIQGRRTVDLNTTWNFNSKSNALAEGACVQIGGPTGEEGIG